MTSTGHAPALAILGLTKHYPDFDLGPLTMAIDPGRVMALVGPNGAGKTTTFDCVLGLVVPESGTLQVHGQRVRLDRRGWRLDIGWVGERKSLYDRWTAQANLDFVGSFYPTWDCARVAALAQRFGVDLSRRVRELSRGNRTKVAILAALGHRPRLLLMDEPFEGLDPVVRAEALDVLWECLEHEETTILYSTHILADVAKLADEVAFLVNGRLVHRSNKDDLVEKWRRISFRSDAKVEEVPAALEHVVDGTLHRVVSRDCEASVQWLRSQGARDIQLARVTLEEIAVEIIRGRVI